VLNSRLIAIGGNEPEDCNAVLHATSLVQWRMTPADFQPKHARIIYGVMSNARPVFAAKRLAQVETWARGLPEQRRFFVVSGRGTPEVDGQGLIVDDRCRDDRSGISCKEARIVEEGYSRNADWLVILGEDVYVNTSWLEDTLINHRGDVAGSKPVALGVLGCGKNWKKNMKLEAFCPEVERDGGICGGGGYAINRAALEVLMREGTKKLRMQYTNGPEPGDMATSCALRQHRVELQPLDGLGGQRIESLLGWEQIFSAGGMFTYHYVTPDVMHWLDALVKHESATRVKDMKALAFDRGCCCSFTESELRDCQEKARVSSAVQLPNVTLLKLWKTMAARYVEERNAELGR